MVQLMCIRHELFILFRLQEETDNYRTIGKRKENSDIAEYHFIYYHTFTISRGSTLAPGPPPHAITLSCTIQSFKDLVHKPWEVKKENSDAFRIIPGVDQKRPASSRCK